MEKNIKAKINNYQDNFKNNLQNWIEKNDAKILINNNNCTNDFIQYLIDFPNLDLTPQDFQKRKRIKNNVPDYKRCIALKCNGERCSRKQKNDLNFCGTHIKGYPYGTISDADKKNEKKQVTLWLEEINGISKYIDDNSNVYSTQDIMNSKENPRIIGKYGKSDDNKYYII